MKMIIKGKNGDMELGFERVTQLCGKNIVEKSYIINSISKHFSSDKYKEYEDGLIENIFINGEVPGRKQFECYLIRNTEDVISTIQMSKGSVLGKCIKEYVGGFDCQNELLKIDDILLKVFERLNKELFPEGCNVELQYSSEDLFSMLQQTSVKTKDGKDIHELSINDLMTVFIEVIRKHQKLMPAKRLYIFENPDYFMYKNQYITFVNECKKLSDCYNSWFIFTTSMDEYVLLLEDIVEGINIINDEVYTLPDEEHLMEFVKNYYPVEREWNREKLFCILCRIIQQIGVGKAFLQPEEAVVLKLLNSSMNVRNCWDNEPKVPEIQCLLDKDVL